MLKVKITDLARADIKHIEAHTLDSFGLEAMDRYLNLIAESINHLRSNPDRTGVRQTLKGLSKYHLSMSKNDAPFAGKIVKQPRHLIFFQVIDDEILEVVRILHDQMDFDQHL